MSYTGRTHCTIRHYKDWLGSKYDIRSCQRSIRSSVMVCVTINKCPFSLYPAPVTWKLIKNYFDTSETLARSLLNNLRHF